MFLERSVLSLYFSLFLLLYEKIFKNFFPKFGTIIIIKEKHFWCFVTIKSHSLCVFWSSRKFFSVIGLWKFYLWVSFSPKSMLIKQSNLSFLLRNRKSKTKEMIHWHLENRYVENSNNGLIRWIMTDKVQTRQNKKV